MFSHRSTIVQPLYFRAVSRIKLFILCLLEIAAQLHSPKNVLLGARDQGLEIRDQGLPVGCSRVPFGCLTG
jgi:hypothetical protein